MRSCGSIARRSGVEVQTDLADELPDVLGDNVQLQQVVLNLVMNAIEAMHSAQSRILRIETRQSGPGTVRVSVGDTGVGIDPSNADRVFERLFTTKSQGMGMGLAICRSIIENHDGRIWATPGPANAARFSISNCRRKPTRRAQALSRLRPCTVAAGMPSRLLKNGLAAWIWS